MGNIASNHTDNWNVTGVDYISSNFNDSSLLSHFNVSYNLTGWNPDFFEGLFDALQAMVYSLFFLGLSRMIGYVIGWVTFAIELPAICVAVYALFRLIKARNVTPVYIINLLLSDLIQVILRPFLLEGLLYQGSSFLFMGSIEVPNFFVYSSPAVSIGHAGMTAVSAVFYFAVLVNNGFVVCIALERYLLVVHPLWYQCRRTIKHSVLLSLAVWVFALISILIHFGFYYSLKPSMHKFEAGSSIAFAVFLLLPFPLLLFFLGATWRALSQSLLVSAEEKRSVLGTLFLVLGNYTLLFTPSVISRLISQYGREVSSAFFIFDMVTLMLLYLNPLVDTLLYIFVTKGPSDTGKAFCCCRRLPRRQTVVKTVM